MGLLQMEREEGIQEGFQQGLKQGILKGMQQGMQQGEIAVLKKIIIRRFGQIPSWVAKRMESASSQDIETWKERIITAETLNEVFSTRKPEDSN